MDDGASSGRTGRWVLAWQWVAEPGLELAFDGFVGAGVRA
jgi:hypothetical protein